jgi:hypothetical protein
MKKPSIAGSFPVTPKDAAAIKETIEIVTARRAGVPKLDIAGLEGLKIGNDGSQTIAVNALASGSAVTFPGLNGDADELYEIIIRGSFVSTVSGTGLFLQPNGLSATFVNVWHRGYWDGAAFSHDVTSAGGNPGFFAGWADWGLNGPIFSRTLIWAKTGQKRLSMGQSVYATSGFPRLMSNVNAGEWDDTSTNIASLNVLVNTSGSFTGTFELRKPLIANRPTQAEVEFLRVQLARLARRLDE